MIRFSSAPLLAQISIYYRWVQVTATASLSFLTFPLLRRGNSIAVYSSSADANMQNHGLHTSHSIRFVGARCGSSWLAETLQMHQHATVLRKHERRRTARAQQAASVVCWTLDRVPTISKYYSEEFFCSTVRQRGVSKNKMEHRAQSFISR